MTAGPNWEVETSDDLPATYANESRKIRSIMKSDLEAKAPSVVHSLANDDSSPVQWKWDGPRRVRDVMANSPASILDWYSFHL
ncbi:uncharacterized protein N7515_001095 [Penicillium bovifimosum]|uniref:Uncharacterized protein n=1 Tax=Penicillium bovifimosum TaxID=126998 RepID=A0A9W9LC29_9EURO|nr:uncharacterized protein N7515_001095 [Penicillium bovifimosum]KAJ5146531.1 hypothetical protein N7515_001095 [Penicillium bovifimosum]